MCRLAVRAGVWVPAVLSVVCATVQGRVPPPAETPARVIVSGRTSTAVSIPVVHVGQEVPATYAGDRIAPGDGFRFLVSEHFALKTDMDDAFAEHVLEISELAHPQWVALTGLEPPDPELRMYIVYASSAEKMIRAMTDDVGMGPQANYGGGITIWANRSAYNYPSGTLRYHRRDLVIHENLHMLQMVAAGTSGTEGLTYSAAQHVYDPVHKRLTVLCFDKPTINNFTDVGLAALRETPVTFREAVDTLWQAGGGPGVVYTQFFLTDPERFLKWRIWRDEFYAGRLDHVTNAELTEDVFGPLDRLEPVWSEWLRQRRSSYHFVEWGWEQEGNALMAYGYPWDPAYWSQTDLLHAPGEPVGHDPLRMDFPAEPVPAIVGPVRRGVEEPVVGYVMDFSRSPDCWGGLGFGVDGRGMCRVILERGQTLVVDGPGLGIERKEFTIPEAVRQAAGETGSRFGVTVRIGRDALGVRIRAGSPGAMAESDARVPLTPAARDRLMTRHLAVIGKDGRPVVTPYIDDGRDMPPDLTVPAPANRWRFPGERELLGLYRAAYRLRSNTPASLTELAGAMTAAVDGDAAAHARAMDLYRAGIDGIVDDVCRIAHPRRDAAAADLLGLSLRLAAEPGSRPGAVRLTALLRNAGSRAAAGRLVPDSLPAGASGALPEPIPVRLEPGATHAVSFAWPGAVGSFAPARLGVTAQLAAGGVSLALRETHAIRPSVPCWQVIGPFDNRGDGTVDTPQPVESEPFDPARSYTGAGGLPVRWQRAERPEETDPRAEYRLDFRELFGGENVSAYAFVRIVSPTARDAVLGVGSDDGVVVWLNGERVHRNPVSRGYSPVQDRVPIRLLSGSNELLLKVMQGTGGWCASARVTDEFGEPLTDLEYSTDLP